MCSRQPPWYTFNQPWLAGGTRALEATNTSWDFRRVGSPKTLELGVFVNANICIAKNFRVPVSTTHAKALGSRESCEVGRLQLERLHTFIICRQEIVGSLFCRFIASSRFILRIAFLQRRSVMKFSATLGDTVHARFPCSKLKLDNLFLHWLSLQETQKLVINVL